MADAAAHEQRNHALRARVEMGLVGGKGVGSAGCIRAGIVGGQQTILIEQRGQRQATDTAAALKQKLTPRPESFHAYLTYRNSFKLSRTCAKSASLCCARNSSASLRSSASAGLLSASLYPNSTCFWGSPGAASSRRLGNNCA